MTAFIAPHAVARTTRFERMLLTTAAAMDRFVTTRIERRAAVIRPVMAQIGAAEARSDALAMGSIGMLPR